MNKKDIYHLLKRYHYIIEAVQRGKNEVDLCICGRRENIKIDVKILTFLDILQTVYKKEKNHLIKRFMEKNIFQGKSNTSVFSIEPLDKSTYYRYKNKLVDILYHCCICKGLVTLQEILEEEII